MVVGLRHQDAPVGRKSVEEVPLTGLSVAIPEPTTLVLIAAAASLAAILRRRRA
jgi:hypothetical protein